MREIEMKLKLHDNLSRSELIDKVTPLLSSNISTKHQIDTVFLLPEQVDSPIVEGSRILRIRDVRNSESNYATKSFMTLKVQKSVNLESDEYEFAVENGQTARELITALGWQEVATVDKIRTQSSIDKFSVCIDEVKHLGLFIELELLVNDDTKATTIQSEMRTLLTNLNLSGDIWDTPYDTSIRNIKDKE